MNTTFSSYDQQTTEDIRKTKNKGFSKKDKKIKKLKEKVEELELL